MARAALYVPEEDEALLQAFDREGALETYLVTGQVPWHVALVLPVVADVYAEMHDHCLDEIPAEIVAYIRRGMAMRLDGAVLGARLIEQNDDPVAAMMAEREGIARIVARRGGDLADRAALEQAEADYRDFQMALGEVEERIIAESTVYDRDGVARLLQDAASTAATTGRADLADSVVGRDVLKAFVALEGRGAMQDLAGGDMDALADYVATPAHRRLAARELLRSARSVGVGLGPDEIEAGLEAVDPGYSRDGGYSI